MCLVSIQHLASIAFMIDSGHLEVSIEVHLPWTATMASYYYASKDKDSEFDNHQISHFTNNSVANY